MPTNESNLINKEVIQKTIKEINNCFNNDFLIKLFRNISNNTFIENKEKIDLSYFSNFDDSIFSDPVLIGNFEIEEGNICILSIKTKKELNERSSKKKQYDIAKSFLKIANEYAGGFFIFYDENSNFRFSFVYDIPLGGGKRFWSNFRRYTYFISKDLTNRTFIEQFSSADFKSLNGIIEAFSVEKVTKEFYEQIANWYFWAQSEVKFPDDLNEGQEKVNQKGLIRLITRLIFIWFLEEKGLVGKELFDYNIIKDIIDFKDSTGSTYYKAILQNLFFATLNTLMKKDDEKSRIFVEDAKKYGFISDGYLQQGFYRYSRFIKDKNKFLKLFENIPFLNGGLFENLDKEIIDNKGEKKVIRIDCFSNNSKNENKLKVPDFLFFAEEKEVDLTLFLSDNKSKKIKKNVKGIFNIFNNYNFTIDENSPVDQEVALDPELLGKVFENLLACYNPETSTTARKATGSFYTPREIVEYMVDESLTGYFLNKLNKENDENFREKIKNLLSYNNEEVQFDDEEKLKLIDLVENCKIIDPACGSGSFLMSVLHKLVLILHKLDPNNNIWLEKILRNLPVEIRKEEEKNLKNKPLDYIRKLGILRNCIFGVDIQEIAIQITKLRFFISLIVDQEIDNSKFNRDIRPLPNLEMNFVAADALIKLNKNDLVLSDNSLDKLENELNKIRSEFFYANSRKEKIKLEEKEKEIKKQIQNLLNHSLSTEYLKKLIEWNPYDQTMSANWFDPEWMFGIKDGFDIVIGNPPYGDLLNGEQKKLIKLSYKYSTISDISSPFIERAFEMLKNHGILIYIITFAITFNKDFSKSRQLIANGFEETFIYTFDRDRCRIFENMTQTVSIMKCFNKGNQIKKGIFTSKMFREAPDIHKIEVSNCNDYLLPKNSRYNQEHRLPKIGDEKNRKILEKLLSFNSNIGNIINKNGSKIWIRTSGNYWYNAFDRKPYKSMEIKSLFVQGEYTDFLIILTNSSLFYFWFRVYGDGRHMNIDILENFPIPNMEKILQYNFLLSKINKSFMNKLFSVFDNKRNRFLTSKIKSEIDLIDLILGKYFYNLDYGEILYIINYDYEVRGGNKLNESINNIINEIILLKNNNSYYDITEKQEKVNNLENNLIELICNYYDLTDEEIRIVEENVK